MVYKHLKEQENHDIKYRREFREREEKLHIRSTLTNEQKDRTSVMILKEIKINCEFFFYIVDIGQ